MSILDNITLIIPAHYGEKYLLRSLAYYSKFGIKILIPDSNKDRFDFENSIYADSENINYIHCPSMPFVEKLHKILPMLETEYIFTSAEDDFIVLKSLIKCIEFLEKHKEYSCVEGNNIRYLYTKDIESYPIDLENYDIDINSDSIKDRLSYGLEFYTQTFYGVTRVENYKDFINVYYENRNFLKNFIFVELLKTTIELSNGKSKVLPIFYNAREYRENSWGGVGANINFLINEEKHKEEYGHFLRICIDFLKDRCDLSKDEFEEMIKKYASHHLPSKPSTLRVVMHKILPSSIKNSIKKKNISKHAEHRIGLAKKLSGYPFNDNKEDMQELLEIKEYIKKYKI